MTLDYYLVRHDTKMLFELGPGPWSAIFPLTCETIQRFGPKTIDWLTEQIRAYENRGAGPYFLRTAEEPEQDYLPYRTEVIRRIADWMTDAPGVYLINDAGDHFDFVHDNGYLVTGTRFGRRVGAWWLAHMRNKVDGRRVEVVFMRHDDGYRDAVTFEHDRLNFVDEFYTKVTAAELDKSRELAAAANASPATAMAKMMALAKPPPPSSKIGRNAPCPCASGKKYKHCCLGKGAVN